MRHENHLLKMEDAHSLLTHLFGALPLSPVPATAASDLRQTSSARFKSLSSRFDPTEWRTLLFELYGSTDAGYLLVRGRSITQEGFLYSNDTEAGDDAWVTVGSLPPTIIAGNLFVTVSLEKHRAARIWIETRTAALLAQEREHMEERRRRAREVRRGRHSAGQGS